MVCETLLPAPVLAEPCHSLSKDTVTRKAEARESTIMPAVGVDITDSRGGQQPVFESGKLVGMPRRPDHLVSPDAIRMRKTRAADRMGTSRWRRGPSLHNKYLANEREDISLFDAQIIFEFQVGCGYFWSQKDRGPEPIYNAGPASWDMQWIYKYAREA